jgi:hypothetical protein
VWFGRAARLTLEDPVEGLDRALLRVRRHPAPARDLGEPDPAWERRLHGLLGAPWPCPARAEFDRLWPEVIELLRSRGLAVGRAAYGGWDDADPSFARAVWCVVVHLAPQKVVETGVARGVTSRFILEALARERRGHLWSIDRPALDEELHPQIGAAVTPHLRDRWTVLVGTSRRRLPSLLRRIAPIDLFVHDSLHTERNLWFELTRAWAAMGGRGVLAADDVERNTAFQRFVEETPGLQSVVAPANDGRNCFGVAVPAPSAGAGASPGLAA